MLVEDDVNALPHLLPSRLAILADALTGWSTVVWHC